MTAFDDFDDAEYELSQSSDDEAAEEDTRRFTTLDAFVDDWFAEMCWVDVTGTSAIWCPEWWRHPAAIVRLEALWRAFEHLRQDPATGMSVWLRDHAEVHTAILTSPHGPFKGCTVTKGHDSTRERFIPTTPAPAGLFDQVD